MTTYEHNYKMCLVVYSMNAISDWFALLGFQYLVALNLLQELFHVKHKEKTLIAIRIDE